MNKLLAVFLLLGGFIVSAQPPENVQKIGHADWEYIFSQLPEYRQIEAELKAYDQQLQTRLTAKAREIELKYKAFQELPANTPDPVRRDKASELTYLQETMQRFEQDAQTSMQKKQTELVNPILDKIGKAIEAVARENGYAYIVSPRQTDAAPFVLFADEKFNISGLVLKKLGVNTENPIKPNVNSGTPRRY